MENFSLSFYGKPSLGLGVGNIILTLRRRCVIILIRFSLLLGILTNNANNYLMYSNLSVNPLKSGSVEGDKLTAPL